LANLAKGGIIHTRKCSWWVRHEEVTMSDSTWQTAQMQRCVQRWRDGDRAAADDLLRALGSRLEHLASRMLRDFPRVRNLVETGDVLQGAVLRLLNCLREVQPATTRDLINLSAVQIRRELLDLAHRFARCQEIPAGHNLSAVPDPAVNLDAWCRFHEAVEALPVVEREVVNLLFYQGWTQPQVAELLGMHERTVRRHWASACLTLNRKLGGDRPAF
jgi:RNA polymerase sigma-70 factor (ECF subfamily)